MSNGNAENGPGRSHHNVNDLLTRLLRLAQSNATVNIQQPIAADTRMDTLSLLRGFIQQQRADQAGHVMVPHALRQYQQQQQLPQQMMMPQQLSQQQAQALLDALNRMNTPPALSADGSCIPIPLEQQLQLQQAAQRTNNASREDTHESLFMELAQINQNITRIHSASQGSAMQDVDHRPHDSLDGTESSRRLEVLSSAQEPRTWDGSLSEEPQLPSLLAATDPSSILQEQETIAQPPAAKESASGASQQITTSTVATSTTPTQQILTNVPSTQPENRAMFHNETFPVKLYRMLQEAEASGKQVIFSFTHSGKAFKVHKPKEFSAEILPMYFRHRRLDSFKRQLSLYGFQRIPIGPEEGAYEHPLFLRGEPHLCHQMKKRDTAAATATEAAASTTTTTRPATVKAKTAAAPPSSRKRPPQQNNYKPE